MKKANNNKFMMTNLQTLITQHFTSLEAFVNHLDRFLAHLAWAYAGKNQGMGKLDCVLIEKLKEAIALDFREATLQFNPPPLLPPEPNDYNVRPSLLRPPVTSVAQAHRIAKARGIRKYDLAFENNQVVFVLDWNEQDFERYDASGGKIWGAPSPYDDQKFIARLLHLM